MYRTAGMVCAAGCVLGLAAGCAMTLEAIGLGGAFTKGEFVMAGSVDEVSLSLQQALGPRGFTLQAAREGEAVRLRATAVSGEHLSLLLTREPTAQGVQTHIHIDWKDGTDDVCARLLADVVLNKTPAGAQK